MRALVLPGLDGTGKLLSDFIEALKPDIHADAMAYPPDVAMDYDELASFVENSLPDGKSLLIAESFSGPIAMRLAAMLPDRFVGLVLCATFAKSPRPWLKPFRGLLDLPLPIPPAGLVDRFAMGRWITPDWKNRIRLAVDALRPEIARKRLSEVLAVDATTDLANVDNPILYLQATEDRLVPRICWLHIRSIAPRARLASIEGPHFLLQARPRDTAAAIRSFARHIDGERTIAEHPC